MAWRNCLRFANPAEAEWRLEADKFEDLGIHGQKHEKILKKLNLRPFKIELGAFKIEAQGLQNRPRRPPRRHLFKNLNLSSLRGASPITKIAILGQLGSKLEAQDPPKLRPKPEKIDVKKQHVFNIDFGRARTSFWKGFW